MSAAAAPVAPPVWDVAVRSRLHDGAGAVFPLDVAFRSGAPRLALFGPSGAGKTQTLRAIAGIAPVDAACIRVAGRTLHDSAAGRALPARQRRLGVVFQDHALFPHLTVRQNIAFALGAGPGRGWLNPDRAVRDARVDAQIERLSLQAVAGLHPHRLSGGQRQRTALARALVAAPLALLLDEPFSSLDRPLRQRLREELLALQQATALPLLLVTHDEDDLRVLAQDVVPVRAGRCAAAPAGAPWL